MDRLTTYGITPNALRALTESTVTPKSIPNAWFNWVGEPRGHDYTQRLELCSIDNRGEHIVTWSRNALSHGYTCFLLTSTEDALRIADIDGLSDDVIPYIIDAVPSQSDPNEHSRMLMLLREPEEFFEGSWAILRRGGERNLPQHSIKASQWWAYAVELSAWIKRAAGTSQAARQARLGDLDFSTWRRDATTPNTNKLMLNCWSLDKPWTVRDIPQLKTHNYVEFYPLTQMPCCGIAIDIQGRLHTVGALPTEADGSWLWDDGSIRKTFSELGWKVKADADALSSVAAVIKTAEFFITLGVGFGRITANMPASSVTAKDSFRLFPPKVLFFDADLEETTENLHKLKLIVSQSISTPRVPATASFMLTTTIKTENLDATAYEIAVKVNDAQRIEWKSLTPNRTTNIPTRIKANDTVSYRLRRTS